MTTNRRHSRNPQQRRFLSLLVAASVALALGCTTSPLQRDNLPRQNDIEPTLILVSFDGFRSDYLDWHEAAGLRQLADNGVRAKGLIPVFPSKTFPCHYSIATGLYPGHHGIVSNNMYDADTGGEFHLSDRAAITDSRWWGGEPIWVTAEKQGVLTAAMFWPGTEVKIAGFRPTYWHPYNRQFSYSSRVEQVLAWLDLPREMRPRFITLYFEYTDDTGHEFGPATPETRAAVAELDARTADLMRGIRQRGLQDKVDLIITSDHGMSKVAIDRVIVVDDYVQLKDGELFEQGAHVQIFPQPGRAESIYAALHSAHPALAIYRRTEIPDRLQLRDGLRTAPIIGVLNAGWEAVDRKRFQRFRKRMHKGNHGQDPRDPSLHGIFVAYGPSFKRGLVIDRFENVQIYNLMTQILGLDPAPNDGDPAALSHILKR